MNEPKSLESIKSGNERDEEYGKIKRKHVINNDVDGKNEWVT